MKIVYDSDTYQVKKYGVEAIYMLIDKATKETMVCEGRQAHVLKEAIDSPLSSLIDITLDGFMSLGRQYGQVEVMEG